MMAATNTRETPYKGLVPYAESDYRLFFGRESERNIITANIMGSRLTLVYGPSGVGKSSVLRAGVVHGIREMAREEVEAYGVPNFVVTFFSQWRDDPLTGLRNEIRRSVQNATGKMPPVPPDLSFADELICLADSVSGKLLIILDQFEEYFLYPQKDGQGSFAYEFPIALSRSDVRANFIVSLREDWYTKLDRFKTTIPHLFDNNLRVDWLNREGARQAIEEPVRVYNAELKNGAPEVRINAGFAAEVINQLEALAERNVLGDTGSGDLKVLKGKGSIQTPYLQLVMSQLWSEAIKQPVPALDPSMLKVPVSGERGATRSEEIIQSHLDSMMKTLSAEEQDVAARAFYHLVTPGGTKIAQQIGDLADYTGMSQSTLNPVLHKLSGKEMSILTQLMPPPNKPSNQVRYELFHDVLAPAILNWRARFNAEQAEAKTKAEAELKMDQERAEAAKQAAQKEKELKAAHERAEVERQRAEDQKARVEAESRARMAEQERAEAEKTRAEDHLRTSKRLGRLSLGLAAMVLFSVAASAFAGVMWRRAKQSEDRALQGLAKAVISEEKANDFAKQSEELRVQGAAAEAIARTMKVQAELAEKVAAAAERRAKVDRAIAQAASAQAERLRLVAADLNQKAQDALQAAAQSEESEKQAQKLNLLYQDALVKYRNKDYQGTIGILTTALPLIENSTDRAYALNLIGYSYTDLDDPGKAVASYNEALEIFRANDDVKGQFYSLRNLGDAYASMEGATAKEVAARHYNEASSGYEKTGSYGDVADVQRKIAKLYSGSEDKTEREKMITALRAAAAAYKKADQKDMAASTLVTLGDSYVSGDSDSPYGYEPAKAEAEYRNAVEIYKEKRDPENAAKTLTKIARLFDDGNEEDKEKSYKAYAEAAQIYHDASQLREEGLVLITLAELQRRHQKSDLAERNYDEAARAFVRAGDISGQARTLRSRAILNNCQTCDEIKKRKAADLYSRAIAMYEKMNKPSALDRRYWRGSLISIVALYKALGENQLADEYKKKLDAFGADPE